MAMEALTSTFVHSTPSKSFPTTSNMQPARPATPSSSAPRYNLRSRNSIGGSAMNETLEETPGTFARMVKEQQGRSKRNFSKWKMAVGKQKEGFSDDE
eukprot:GFUD01030472.1.p1 GENE.GFUD01030472.1~~GFUD01030472.1.p1  ORF type:complete len:113 (-),score=41.15 GFUD01030472.1:140-433(-)